MSRTFRWIGSAAWTAAARVRTEASIGPLVLAALLGYLVLCVVIYPGSQR